jgi:hypothetical protein
MKNNKKKNFNNFKQNWQCSLLQIVHLTGDNIFRFT